MINEKHFHKLGVGHPEAITKRAGGYKIVKINREPLYAKVYIKEEFDMKDRLIKKQDKAFNRRGDKQKYVDTYEGSILVKTNYEKDVVNDVKDNNYGCVKMPVDIENQVTDFFKNKDVKNVGFCDLGCIWDEFHVAFIMEKDKIKDEYTENVDVKEITDSGFSVLEGFEAQPLDFCDCIKESCKHNLNPYGGNKHIIMGSSENKETLNIEHIDTESEIEEYSNDEEEYKSDEGNSFKEKNNSEEKNNNSEEEYGSD